jgi:DUF971 family protein
MADEHADAHAEPSGKQIVARDIKIENENKRVLVQWADGHTSVYPISRLRGYCPCAECQGHGVGGLRYIDNGAAAIFAAELVGRYAINFKFGDAHDTGIFRWDMLRKLDPEEQERWGPPERIGRS